MKGLPYPILQIAEVFTIDYDRVRIGRYYRQAGWFAHIFIWLVDALSSRLFIEVIFVCLCETG